MHGHQVNNCLFVQSKFYYHLRASYGRNTYCIGTLCCAVPMARRAQEGRKKGVSLALATSCLRDSSHKQLVGTRKQLVGTRKQLVASAYPYAKQRVRVTRSKKQFVATTLGRKEINCVFATQKHCYATW
jgi:hypothetical protein